MKDRYAISVVALVAIMAVVGWMAGLINVGPSAYEQKEQERAAFAEFLAQHAYSQHQNLTEEELEGMSKTDRPDLAIEQDFLMTLDPALGYVPKERLWTANQIADDLKDAVNR